MELPFPVGSPPLEAGPLARFLPPLEEGVAARVLDRLAPPDAHILDPFGASPRLAVEIARTGRGVTVAVNNPILRFILEHTAQPFRLSELQAALAQLAAATKDGSRLELFLLDLYRSECARCGGEVTADYYTWEREQGELVSKGYACENCGYTGESPATEADWERAESYARRGLARALALEQVAPAGDPDRDHAEAALAVYPGRALYGLTTLINKLQQLTLEAPIRAAIHALLLTTFDEVNALWGHPEGRSRPRQLIASQHFREKNIWRALERSVSAWALKDPGVRLEVGLSEAAPDPGTIALFPGSVRDLAAALPEGSVSFLLTVPPRPNQAFWTLNALWAAWLWERETAASIKVALRRRRYDWVWHANAMRTVMKAVTPVLTLEAQLAVILPEAEPGFVAATLSAFDMSGYSLEGRALRLPDQQAFFTWSLSDGRPKPYAQTALQESIRSTLQTTLEQRADPTEFATLHSAVWSDLARQRQLAPQWKAESTPPLTQIGEWLTSALADRKRFMHLSPGADPERGRYWLQEFVREEKPLGDRVEKLVLEILREQRNITELELDDRVCQALPGILTPGRRLVKACLRSYAHFQEDGIHWILRPEDEPEARAQDCRDMVRLLNELGRRLGYEVRGKSPLTWTDERGERVYAFYIFETAEMSEMVYEQPEPETRLVLPGGRAALVAEKARRNPRLLAWLQEGTRVVKFRHVRRLTSEMTLTKENLGERLAIDPPEHQDPQLPLL